MDIQYGATKIEFNVEYSKRKTFEIRINPPNSINIKAPNNATEEQIKEVVFSKTKWIIKKLEYFKEIGYEIPKKEFINEELFYLKGQVYSLKIIEDKRIKKPIANFNLDKLFVYTNNSNREHIQKAIKECYKRLAQEVVEERVAFYKNDINTNPNSIKAKEQKKRWGSCNLNKDLMFNWRIVMAPLNIIDYIVVHEMCHMIHMNHSKKFWNEVEKIIPDYKDRRNWLKINGIKLSV